MPPTSKPDRLRIVAAAHRETFDGLPVLHLAGTPYEVGLQHGALCRDEIHAFRRAAFGYMSTLIAITLRLPRALARLVTRPLLLRQVGAYLPFTPHEYLEEMRGVAAGAGVQVLEALLVNAVWEMYLAGGCSEFAVRGSRTADGDLIHGYNYDLAEPAHAFINPYLALIFVRPAAGFPFAHVNTVGCVGANAGLSARGISVAWDNTHLRLDSPLLAGVPRHCTPFVLVLRRLLQYGDSVDAGVDIVRSHLPRPFADIVIVGDGHANRAVALELAGAATAVREMRDDAVWSANSFVSPALGPEDRRAPPGDDPEETARRLGRYVSYAELLGQSSPAVDVPRAVALLRDPYPREQAGYVYPPPRRETICRRVTSFSLVMQPRAQRLWIGDPHLPAPLGRYMGFDLRTECPVPGAPVPSTGYSRAVQGHGHVVAGRWPDALREFEGALALDGESVPLRLMLANVHRALGQESAARAQLARVRAAGVPPGARLPFPSAIAPLTYLTLAETGST